MNKKYDLIVLGSGPGGYVSAIRASQLGLKTAIVEKESLGGVCLNWGCIPTKALLKSAQVFEYLKKADTYGLKIKDFDKDFESVVKRSRGVADGMSKGVNFLMKKNKIDVINGFGKIKPGKKVDVDGKCFSVQLKSGNQSALVDECPAAAASKAFVEGLTWGIVDTTPSEESHVQALVNFFEQKDMDCEVDKYPFKVRDGMGGSYGYELKYSCKENL